MAKVKRLRIFAELEDGKEVVVLDKDSQIIDLSYEIRYDYVEKYEHFGVKEIEPTGSFQLSLKAIGSSDKIRKKEGK